MKRILFILRLFPAVAFAYQQSDLEQLDYYLEHKADYDQAKIARIDSLRNCTDKDAYDYYAALFEEFASYNYDSAHLYVDRLLDEAVLHGDKNLIARARINKSFTYLSAGLFKESADMMESIDIAHCNDSVKLAYYNTYARLMYDLADYNRSELYYEYISEGNRLSDSALVLLSPQDTVAYWYTMAVRDMKQGNNHRSLERFLLQLQSSQITEHERAITYSSMGYIYYAMGDMQRSCHYNILAVISDIKNSTKEAVALRNVAMELFNEGETHRAVRYIRYALDDAQFYNARHRQLEISQILPIIEHAQVEQLEEQNHRIRTLSMITYLLIAVLVCVLILLYNRIREVNKSHTTIQEINRRLSEANRIKEEYISTFLSNQAENMNKFTQYQRFVKKRAMEHRMDELLSVPPQFNATRTRKEFYKQFDEMFLRIFPDFIDNFNGLLRDGEKLHPVKGELLTTELRIFALIRLGVTDNEKIAQILDYSVNTIYTYKTRTKNHSDLSNDEFMQRLMEC